MVTSLRLGVIMVRQMVSFLNPFAVAVDSAGHVFVADALQDRIQKFDNNGGFMKSWNTVGIFNGNGPTGLDVQPFNRQCVCIRH